MTLSIAALTVMGAACGNSRGANQGEETVPRITPAPTVSTVAATVPPTTISTTTTAAPTIPPPPPTTPSTPWPTSLRTDPPTNNPPATTPQVAQVTFPPSQPAPTEPTGATSSAPTSTVVVNPSTPPDCTPASIGEDTGQLTITNLSCNAGWAVGLVNQCPTECEGRDVFHVTPSGWEHDGYFPSICAEGLTGSGMSIYTAASFTPNFCADPPGATEVIRPDSTGERVMQLQTALVAEGYQVSVDGAYGPRTQAAVRDFQTRTGLEVDGIAGPLTQGALGIGPNGSSPTSPTPPTSPTVPPTAVPSTIATSATVAGVGAGAECTAAAIGEDLGRPVDVISACHSGWAIGRINDCSQAPCPTVDVFHITDRGWVYDTKVAAGCAEELHDAGMSAYTAGDFSSWCGVPNLPQQRRVIEPGSAGVAVTHVQIALVALGYPIAVDGTYGPGTESAIRDFQSRNGLAVDGIAGPDTRTALGL